VFLNLIAGLDALGIEYFVNLPFNEIRPDDKIGFIGRGRACLEGYKRDNPILAGVAVVQHPDEWPTLFEDYPVARYVVHSKWVADEFRKGYGDRIVEWAVGIDTMRWAPADGAKKKTDVLVYDKIRWSHDLVHSAMVVPIVNAIRARGLSIETIRYGAYKPSDLSDAFDRCRMMLFLCEHETQGLAYQQAMSAGLPVLAWDPGQWLDPWRFRFNKSHILATSVPFFDGRCGRTFTCLGDFEREFDTFISDYDTYNPRDYVTKTLSLEDCARNYIALMSECL
jgi:hypothetical protein